MKLDSKFFEQRWIRAIQAEFGAQGVLAVIRLLCSIFDSPQGYWRDWSTMDEAVLAGEAGMTVADVRRLLDRLVDYGVINGEKLRRHHTVTSRTIQLEYIRQAGVSRARRLDWKTHSLIPLDELLELGIAPAIVEEFDEDYGVPLPVSRRSPGLYPHYRQIRLRHRDPRVHLYRVVKLPLRPASTCAAPRHRPIVPPDHLIQPPPGLPLVATSTPDASPSGANS